MFVSNFRALKSFSSFKSRQISLTNNRQQLIQFQSSKFLTFVTERKTEDYTYVSLQHIIMFLFGAERFFEHCDMSLVILMLFLQRLHLRRHRQQLLVSSLYFRPEFVQLRKDSSSRRGSVPVPRPSR